MKPEKYTCFEFVFNPFLRLFDKFIHAVKVEGLGYWWCSYCKVYHSPRIKKYINWHKSSGRHRRYYCSLGLDKSQEVD